MKRNMLKLCAMLLSVTALTGAGACAEESAVQVGSLKGPTSMGIVSLMEKAEAGETAYDYEFTMATAADDLLSQVIGGKLDIAMAIIVICSTAEMLWIGHLKKQKRSFLR